MKKILIIMAVVFSTVNADDKIKLMTEIFPPFQYSNDIDKKLIGISTEIVQAIQKEVGSKDKIKVYPWVRGLKIVDKKKNTALFSMLRTKERERKYKWVGPITSMQLIFFKKKGSSITLNSIEDAKKVGKVGVTKGVANYDILNGQGFKNLDVIKSGHDEKNIKKLAKGRIDLWPTLLMAGIYNSKRMGFSGEIVPIENVVVFSGDMYIAFNLKTDDIIISKWQDALDKLKANKSVEKIIKRYK